MATLQRDSRRKLHRSGFTLIELLIVVVIMAVAFNLLLPAMAISNKLGPMNRESSLAMQALRTKCEEMQAVSFEELWVTYNADPADDPGGAGTAPGAAFDVPELQTRTDDPDGFVGEVIFPTTGTDLREDIADRDLGMPRDLNGDGVVDALDHAGDYEYLPVRVRLEWRNKYGLARQLEIHTALTQ